jgi:DNA-binding transcriptional ArsR family regulator
MPHAPLYQAIADQNRRHILDLLRTSGPLRANELAAHLSHISQPAVSKHLRVLRHANLVYDVKDGRERWYHLNSEPLRLVGEWLQRYEPLWDERLAGLHHHFPDPQ